jgi:hypothetical protein
MNPLTQFKKTPILPLLIAPVLVALASPAVAHANAVTDWNNIAVSTLLAFPPLAGGAPPAQQVSMAMTHRRWPCPRCGFRTEAPRYSFPQ